MSKTFIVAQWLSMSSISDVHDACLSCGVKPSYRPEYNCYIQSYSSSTIPDFEEDKKPISVYLTDVEKHFNGMIGLTIESNALRKRMVSRDMKNLFKDLQDEILIAPQADWSAVERLRLKLHKKPLRVILLNEILLETVT